MGELGLLVLVAKLLATKLVILNLVCQISFVKLLITDLGEGWITVQICCIL